MKDEKKKNKKKKNKQNKSAADHTNGVEDSANTNQNHDPAQDHQSGVSEIPQVQYEVQKTDGVTLEEAIETSQRESIPLTEQQAVPEEREIRLQDDHGKQIENKDSMEETSIGLQNDNGAHIRKEASMEDTRLQNDNNLQQEASLEDTNTGLLHDNGVDIKKEDSLDEKIKRLQEENKIHLHKEASLESKLLQLEEEKTSWLQKQARLEEQFNHLVEETDTLKSKETSLEEKVKQLEAEKDFKLEKENSNKETMVILNGNVSRLQAQVKELEESKNYLLHENQQLGENISSLQIQIKVLEESFASVVSSSAIRTVTDRDKNPDTRGILNNDFPDAASKLTVEIAEQFGNKDSTSAFTDRRDISEDILIQDGRSIADDLTKNNTAPVISSLSDSRETTFLPGKTVGSFEDVAFRSEGDDYENINAKETVAVSNSPYVNGSDEIVQVPLYENHVVAPSLQPQLPEEKTDVPLTDSPLIGAPFRMISFFARYVSGGDLVNKS